MISAFIEMISSVLLVIDYIERATEISGDLFVHIKWINEFIESLTECLQMIDRDADSPADIAAVRFPDLHAPSQGNKVELFSTARHHASTDLQAYLTKWSYHQEKYYFTRPGHESQEVTVEPQIAALTSSHGEARRVFEDAARVFTERAVTLELL
jgi:hypothetical protein